MPYPRRAQTPERYLHPRVREVYLRDARASLELSFVAGFPHHSHFSAVINSVKVKDTPLLRQRLERLADALGYPRDEIYLAESVEVRR
jgi:hypothetical protein